MAGTANDNSTDPWQQFRLLSNMRNFFLELTDDAELLADRLTQKFLEGGEVDRDGRTRYKLYEIEAIPGGVAPSPYDGEFWRSYPECDIHCKIDAKNSSARWTGPTSKEWQAQGRQRSEYDVYMIRVCWGAVLEFLQSAGLLPAQDEPPTSSSEQPEPERTPDQELKPEPLSSTAQPKPPQPESPRPESPEPEPEVPSVSEPAEPEKPREQEHTARVLTAEEVESLVAKYRDLRKVRPKLKQADIVEKLRNAVTPPVSISTIYRLIITPSA
jgi:hypothetical protein